MDQPVEWVDVESAVREWARDTVTSVDRRVFFGHSDTADADQIVLTRIAGPDDSCLIQFDVHHRTKALAAALAAELATAIDALSRYESDGVILYAASKPTVRWLPDPESDSPRYVVESTFAAASAALSGS